MPNTVLGLDAGVAGYSSICVLQGNKWDVQCVSVEAVHSINGPDLEALLARYHAKYQPRLVVMEQNGPGATLGPYFQRNQPQIPLATVDVVLPLPEDYELLLWDDIRINNLLVLNIRATMYWILRLLFRDQKIKLMFDDEELEIQLGTLRWDNDPTRGDKIYMLNKKKLKFKSSELDSEPFSKSPDKADSLALAVLGYSILMQQEVGEDGEVTQGIEEDDIIDPITEGFFQLDHITQEATE